MARIIAVCKSDTKGTGKESVNQGVIREDYGLEGDAHADCCTHRQVSLLAIESIDKIRSRGLQVVPGDFGENFTTQGIDLPSLPIGTRLHLGEEAIVAVSQIGKECHTPCAIYRQAGTCVMPDEGVFARVIHGGKVRAGDPIQVEPVKG